MNRRGRFVILLSVLSATLLSLGGLGAGPGRLSVQAAQERSAPETRFQPVAQFGGSISGVAVAGRHAYIDRGRRLEVLDIGDPTAPKTLGTSAPLPARAKVVAAADGLVVLVEHIGHVSGPAGRLFVVDVTRPAAPRLRGSLDLGGHSLRKVAWRDGLLYAAAARSGLLVLDVRDRDHPRFLGAVATDLPAEGLALSGEHLLVAVGRGSGEGGLRVFGLADPSRPALLAALDVGRDAHAVAALGRYALLATWEQLLVVDLLDPARPRVASQTRAYDGIDLAVGGSRAWLKRSWAAPRDSYHLALFDLADLPTLRPLGELPLLTGGGMALTGDLLLAADGERGLLTVGPTDPGAKTPTLLHQEPTLGSPGGIVIEGGHAYVSDQDGEVWVLGLQDPAAPALLGRAALRNEATPGRMEATLGTTALAVRDGLAFVTRKGFGFTIGGLHVVDVSDPAAPRQVGRWDADQELDRHPELATTAVSPNGYPPLLSGDRLWFTGRPLLTELDISDPTTPRLGRAIDHPYPPGQGAAGDKAGSVAVAAGRAWVAEPVTGLHLFDTSPGGALRPLARSATAGSPSDVLAAGAQVLVADGPGGLLVLDAQSLAPLRSLPQVPAERLLRSGDTLIAAAQLKGDAGDRRLRLSAIDITDPSTPLLRGTHDLAGSGSWSPMPADLAVAGDLLYVTAGAEGLAVLRLEERERRPLWLPLLGR